MSSASISSRRSRRFRATRSMVAGLVLSMIAGVLAFVAPAPSAVQAATDDAGSVVSVVPSRLLETRVGQVSGDGLFAGGGRVGAGEVLELPVLGRGGVPGSGVGSVVLNVTAIGALGRGFLTVFPCGDRPLASSLNFGAGSVPVANEVVAKVSGVGSVCLFASAELHLAVDVTGYVAEGASVVSVVPSRLLETRVGQVSGDGLFAGGGRVGAGEVLELPVLGRGGVPGSGVGSVVLNVTAIGALGRGFLTVFPCGDRPLASSLNFGAGSVPVANEVVAKVSGVGSVCLFASAELHLAVDVTGYVAEGASVVSVVPSRLLETRVGQVSGDGLFAGGGRVGAGEVLELPVLGRGGVPGSGVGSVVLNVTAIGALGRGFLTVFPCGDRPLASSLNFGAGSVPVANEVVAKVSGVGSVCLFASAELHLAVDVTGYVNIDDAPDPQQTLQIEDYSHEAGWQIIPSDVFFTAPGETATAQLVHFGTDGQPSGLAVPSGATIVRTSPTFDIDLAADGEISIEGGSAIGAELIGVDLGAAAGEATPPTMWVSSMRLDAGVRVLEADEIAFPPPRGADIAGVAPFTLDELMARYREDAQGQPDRVPVVLRGEVPATGTTIAGTDVLGIVAVDTGLQPIEREGLTLVMLDLVPATDVFTELDVSMDFGALFDAGLIVPDFSGITCVSSVDDCSDDAAQPKPFTVDEARQRRVILGPDQACKTGIEGRVGELKFILKEPAMSFGGDFDFQMERGVVTTLVFAPRVTVDAGDIGVSGKLQAKLVGKFECELIRSLASLETAFPGPLAAILSVMVRVPLKGVVEASATGGPQLNFKKICQPFFTTQVGFEYTSTQGASEVSDSDYGFPCEAGEFVVDGDFDTTVIQVKAGPAVSAKTGMRAGGTIVRVLGALLGSPGLGEILPIEFKVGASGVLKWESFGSVELNDKHASGAALEGAASLGLNKGEFENFFKKTLGFTFFPVIPEISVPLFSLDIIKFSQAAEMGYTINGQTSTSADVQIGDTLKVTSRPFQATFVIPNVGATPVDGPFTVSEFFNGSNSGAGGAAGDNYGFDFEANGSTATAELVVDDAFCDRHSTEKSYTAFGQIDVPLVSVPLRIGRFSVHCPREINFAEELSGPAAIRGVAGTDTISLNRGRLRTVVVMTQAGFDARDFDFILPEEDPAKPTFSISPVSGTFGTRDQQTRLAVEIECPETLDTRGSEEIRVRVESDGQMLPYNDARITVVWNCSPDWITVEPRFVRPNDVVTIRSSGQTEDTWRALTARVRFDPESDDLPVSGTEIYERQGVVRLPPGKLPQPCQDSSEQRRETGTVILVTDDRGQTYFSVDLTPSGDGPTPQDQSQSCDKGSAGSEETSDPSAPGSPNMGPAIKYDDYIQPCSSCGDPHMVSFDGQHFDAQVVGEYVYAETESGTARVVARHDRSLLGADPTVPVSSVVAMALEFYGLDAEAYAGPDGLTVYIDGTEHVVNPGHVESLGGGFDVTTFSDQRVHFYTPLVSMSIENVNAPGQRPRLDVRITPSGNGELTGLLGTDNGVASDDLRHRDGTALDLDIAREHGAELYAFTDSWRLTELADSPFTVPSPIFDTANDDYPLDSVLDPFRLEATERLDAISSICVAGLDDEYAIEMLALELAIGTPDDQLSQFTCGYRIAGNVTVPVDGAALGVAGGTVTVDAPGLQPCTTGISGDGSYTCELIPDFVELAAGDAEFPLVVEVAAAGPGDPSNPQSTTTAIEAPAALGSFVTVDDVDIEFEQSDLVIVDLTGQLSSQGLPDEGVWAMLVEPLDASGDPMTDQTFRVDVNETGDYRLIVNLDARATSVRVTWLRSLEDAPQLTETFDSIGPGVNALAFSADFSPPVVDLSGTATVNNAPAGEILLRFDYTHGDASTSSAFRTVTVDPLDGSYFLQPEAPLDAVAATITVTVPNVASITGESITIDPLVPGANPAVLDLDADAVDVRAGVDVTGRALIGGDPYTSPIQFLARFHRTTGGFIDEPFIVTPDPLTGDFDFATGDNEGIERVTIIARTSSFTNWFIVDDTDIMTEIDPAQPGRSTVFLPVELSGTLLEMSATFDNWTAGDQANVYARDSATGDFIASGTFAGDGESAATAAINLGEAAGPVDVLVSFDFYFATIELATDVDIEPGVVELDGLTADAEQPSISLTGTLTENGSPFTDDFEAEIVWTDADGAEPRTWNWTLDVTPNPSGEYTIDFAGPVPADRADITLLVPAPLVDRTFTFDPLVAGDNTDTFDASWETKTVTITSNADVGTRSVDVFIELFDALGDSLGTIEGDSRADDLTEDDMLEIVIPVGAATGIVTIDLSEEERRFEQSDPALVFVEDIGIIAPTGDTSVTVDVDVRTVTIDATVQYGDGTPLEYIEFEWTMRTFDGGVAGTELSTFTHSSGTDEFGQSTFDIFLPPGADAVIFEPLVYEHTNDGPFEFTGLVTDDESRTLTIVATPDP